MIYTYKPYITQYLKIFYQNTTNKKLIPQYILDTYKNILLNNNFISISNVIEQSKEYIFDIPENLIADIALNNHMILSYDQLQLKQFFKQSKHYRNIKNLKLKDLLVAKFNFSDYNQIFKFHINLGFNQQDSKLLTSVFDEKIDYNCNGAYDQGVNIIYLNTYYDQDILLQTAHHQLSHYFQITTGIKFTNSLKNKKITSIELVKHLFSPLVLNIRQQLNYWFNQKQFYPHIDTLIFKLVKTKKQFYTDITFENFLHYFVKQFSTNNKNILKHKFINQYKIANKTMDISQLIMFICSYILKIKYQKIISLLELKFHDLDFKEQQ